MSNGSGMADPVGNCTAAEPMSLRSNFTVEAAKDLSYFFVLAVSMLMKGMAPVPPIT